MVYRKILIITMIISIASVCHAQKYYGIGALPISKISKGLKNNYSIANENSLRLNYIKGYSDGSTDRELGYALADLSLFLYKENKKIKWESGFLVRLQDNPTQYRFIQGAYFDKHFPCWSLSQRARIDLSVGEDINPIYRGRYKVMGAIPIFKKSKKGSWKFYLSAELLNIIQSGDYFLEFRTVPNLDWTLPNKNNLEFGIDYRLAYLHPKGFNINNLWIVLKYNVHLD